MSGGGRSLTPELLQEVEPLGASCSRRQIARRLCQLWEWRGPSGRFQEMSARKLLLQWERAGQIKLPPARPAPPGRRNPSFKGQPDPAFPPLQCSLAELGPIQIVLIPSRHDKASREWNQLLDRYHYLGAGPLCGDQLRYLVRCAHGVLAGLSFSAAARQLAGRDLWIGWDQAARRENLHLVVNNSRFLIRTEVQVPHLASHILGRVLRRLPEDWQVRYGYRPVLAETFVERGRFAGISYQAANWQAIGLTTGRGRQDSKHQRQGAKKAIWVCPLQKNFRQTLQTPPARPRLAPVPQRAAPATPPPADWAEQEFAQAPLKEARLTRRLCGLARDFYARPGAQLPQACGSRAKTKAAYRFLSHPRACMQTLLSAHYQATTRRASQEAVVLAVQDTTSLNYSAHPATEMLGLIGSKPTGPIGMLVHSTLAFNEAGTPLGLLDVQHWVRDPDEFGKKHQRHQLPLEAKESARWLRSLEAVSAAQARCPNTRFVGVGDREADIYELFVWSQAEAGRPALLVRAEKDRLLSQDQGHLWEAVAAAPLAGTLELKIPRRGAQPARQALVEVRHRQVELKAPRRKSDLPGVRLWAVLARESNPPPGIEPVQWMLLCTLAVDNFESAVEKLRWYAGRWGIEVFHRVLKSGCKIEQRQLAGADRLEACLAIDLVVAWRIFQLTKLGRETPEVPCTVYFEEHEWKALVAHATRNPEPPPRAPSLREAIRMTASLGGFLGRKSDGEPGAQTLWLGLQRLDDLAAMYLVMSKTGWFPPAVSSNRTYG
jgi:hypothetical protein